MLDPDNGHKKGGRKKSLKLFEGDFGIGNFGTERKKQKKKGQLIVVQL